MSVNAGVSHQTMTSRINYNAPLKSVRTVRPAKIDQCDPSNFSDGLSSNGEPARRSDADFTNSNIMNRAGIAFVWENAPGHSKTQQEKASPLELKPPPQQALAPSSSSKVEDTSPPPAGTPAVDTIFNRQIAASTGILAVKSKLDPLAKHQLPPKPAQRKVSSVAGLSVDKSPPKPRKTSVSVPLSEQSTRLYYNAEHAHQSGHSPSRTGRQTSVGKEGDDHSTLLSTLYAFTSGDQAPTRAFYGEERASHPSFEDQAPRSTLKRGNQRYLEERLGQGPMQVGKNFYFSGENSFAANVATLPNSCMPTRPNSRSASEAGSHSDEDWDGDQTDVGDAFSQMNARDHDAHVRCQVSVLDGEQHDTSRHTDPRARDFIMERFLPAAKAMVTESLDGSDRRSSQDTSSVSPTRGKGRSSLPGRSRFAFKDRYARVDEQDKDVDQSDMLFKCKFPWQMGALTANGPQTSEPSSVEQSPAVSFGKRTESWSEVHEDEQHDVAWGRGETEENFAPKGNNSRSFEDRALPPNSRIKYSSDALKSQPLRSEEIHSYDRALSVSEESANGECLEGEHSSKDLRGRVSYAVPNDRSSETAAHRDPNSERNTPSTRRAPEITFSGSLGTLLRTTQQQRRDLGRISGAAIEAAVASVPEGIPPSSILNHHRNKPARPAAKSAVGGSQSYLSRPNYRGNTHDESNYPKHLNVGFAREHDPEPSGASGRSLESINDEVWEASGHESSSGVKSTATEHYGIAVTSSHLNSPDDSVNDDVGATGWPLGKAYTTYARTPSSDSKDASFSSFSDHSVRSPLNPGSSTSQEKSSTDKFSPVSVLPPPLPKSPSESWLFKVRPPVPPSTGSNWRSNNQSTNPKKFLEHSVTNDSMDMKWEVLVTSENAQLGKLAQGSPHFAEIGSHGGG